MPCRAVLCCVVLWRPWRGQSSDGVCQWLFEWFTSRRAPLQRFVMAFLPALLWRYVVRKTAMTNNHAGIEAVLAR